LEINQQILNSLTQNGYVPFYYQQDNQTYELRLGLIAPEGSPKEDLLIEEELH